jgi:hypothetical protein
LRSAFAFLCFLSSTLSLTIWLILFLSLQIPAELAVSLTSHQYSEKSLMPRFLGEGERRQSMSKYQPVNKMQRDTNAEFVNKKFQTVIQQLQC